MNVKVQTQIFIILILPLIMISMMHHLHFFSNKRWIFSSMSLYTFIIFILSITSCNLKSEKEAYKEPIEKDTVIDISHLQSILPIDSIKDEKTISANFEFIGDTLLHGYSDIVKYYVLKYQRDTCIYEKYSNSHLGEVIKGIKTLGDLNSDDRKDFVFILPPLNQCEVGGSYYFSDTIFPRLLTESNCCRLGYIFNVGDIDEDGICEIGQYYSSCVSRYKALYVYSLKNKEWKVVGRCTFDIDYSKTNTNYKSYVKKISKGHFEMLEFTDLTEDKSKIGKRNWLKFTI